MKAAVMFAPWWMTAVLWIALEAVGFDDAGRRVLILISVVFGYLAYPLAVVFVIEYARRLRAAQPAKGDAT